MNQEFRFSGIERLYGEESNKRIQKSHIMIIGLGGVGSWVAESLARTGVGSISLVDMDEVCESNINRQIQALTKNIGKAKIDCLKERILQINPNCQVNCIFDFFGNESADSILSLQPDLVIDAFDSLLNKILLASKCKQLAIPLICSGAAGGKMDPTKIEIADLCHVKHDPLLSQMRKKLRQKHGFPRGKKDFGIPCVFSVESADLQNEDKCEIQASGKLDCAGSLGSISYITGCFGFFAAHLAIQNLIKSK